MPSPDQRREAEHRQVRHLSTAAVRSRLEAVLTRRGAILTDFDLVDLQHRPGAGATGVFRILSRDDAASAAAPRELYLALTAEIVPEEAVFSAGEGDGGTWSGWWHPHDPILAGLPLASDPGSVATLWAGGGELVDLHTVSYRPLRRAVLRAVVRDGTGDPEGDGAGGPTERTLFLKVLRGGQGSRLHRRHVLLAAAGVPVPRVIGPPVADVIALEQGRGTPLAEAIMADGARSVDPAGIVEVLDRMPAELIGLPAREAWADRTPDYGHAAATALPDESRRIGSLVDHLQRLLATTDRGPVVPTHGDLYEANLLMDGGRISSMLDIDGAGPGHRVDDLACFLGHLAVLPAVDSRYVHVEEALRRFHGVFVTGVDPAALASRSAAVALSLVAGARDSGRPDWRDSARQRLRIAEALLELPQSASGW